MRPDGRSRCRSARGTYPAEGRYSNTATFTYDEGGRVATYTIARDYEAAGRLSEITYLTITTVTRTLFGSTAKSVAQCAWAAQNLEWSL